jgi:hypothetical protein
LQRARVLTDKFFTSSLSVVNWIGCADGRAAYVFGIKRSLLGAIE